MTNNHSFPTINSRSWPELLMEDWGGYPKPLTVHLPVHPAHSRDFVHVGPALEVARQRVGAGFDARAPRAEQKFETLLVQFALGKLPSVPDFRRSKLSLAAGHYPIAQAEYYSYGSYGGLVHQFEYFCAPISDNATPQSLLCIRGTVTNCSRDVMEAHIWPKIGFHQEDEIFPYHYVPYDWDASKLLPCDRVSLRGEEILRDGEIMGRVLPHEFALAWEKQRDFSDEEYEKYFHEGIPGTQWNPAHPSLRYYHVRDALHLSRTLQPQEEAVFELVFFVNYEEITSGQRQILSTINIAEMRQNAIASFDQLKPATATELTFPAQQWGDIFAHMPLNILQLLPEFPELPGYLPTQGGTTERHFVWLGECVFMLLPMLKLGYFEPVRRAIDYIFALQDTGYAPQGRLQSTEGAIGTTGPRWLCSTGMALSLIGDYCSYSHDETFLSENLVKILHAMDWIVNEVRATRVLDDDGSRPLYYGLMPFGVANDGDHGYSVSFTDAYTFWGLEKAVQLLERIEHENAADYRAELEQYRGDIACAVAGLAQENGDILRSIVTGDPEERIYHGFDLTCAAYHLGPSNAYDVNAPLFARYIEHFENTIIDEWFAGKMDYDTVYIGVPEWAWQEIYLRRGEWKKAFAMQQINLRYGITAAHQVQERFRRSDPRFAPWQPNGSGNGRMIDMLLNALYFEREDTATLLAGVPFELLRQNGKTELRNLHTPRGVLHLSAEMADDKHCKVCLEADLASAMPAKVLLPDYFKVVQPSTDRRYDIPRNVQRAEFVVAED